MLLKIAFRSKGRKERQESLVFDHEELIDLLRDKKSPWYELIDWTTDAGSIRETNVVFNDKKKNRAGVDLACIENYFSCLRFNDKRVSPFSSGLFFKANPEDVSF